MSSTVVHLHSTRSDCSTVCGLPCGSRETTAYAGLDPERVTCSACLPPVVDAPAADPLERDAVILKLRAELKRRTGRAWSVTGGRGTS